MINKFLLKLCEYRKVEYVNWDKVMRVLVAESQDEVQIPKSIMLAAGLGNCTQGYMYGRLIKII